MSDAPRTLLACLALLLPGCAAIGPVEPAGAPGAPSLACVGACRSPIDDSPGGGWEPHVALHPTDQAHVVVATRPQGSGATPGSYVLWFDLHVSTDGGRTWRVTPVRETAPLGSRADPDAPNVVGDPVLAFLPDGALLMAGATLQYVATPAGGVLREVRLFVARSPDGGFTVEPPVVVARSEGVLAQADLPAPLPPAGAAALMKLPDKPWIATGPRGEALLAWVGFAAFHPESPAGFRSDVLVSSSRDGGRSWDGPRLVARGPGGLQGPSPVVGSDGAWHVAYVDLETQEARVATSRDGGATWDDRAVAPAAWMPSLAVSREPWGDRLLLASATPDGAAGDAARQTPTLSWSDDGGATWTQPLALDPAEAPGRALPSVAAADGVAYVTYAHAKGDAASEQRAVALRPGGWRADLVLDGAIAGPTWRLGDYLGLAAGPAGAFAVWSSTTDGREYDVVGGWMRATDGPG